jgi:hypothetical protein
MQKHVLRIRTISDAVYLKNNPSGDSFKFNPPKTLKEAELFGFGLGLYWGEGTKADKTSVRLGNTDPELIEKFIEFLVRIFSVNKKKLRFGLQVFSGAEGKAALDFWQKKLKISEGQFYQTTLTKSRGHGSYGRKAKYGVLTVYFHNRKLRDLIISMLLRTA